MKILSYGVPVTQYYEHNTIQPPTLKEGDKWYCPSCGHDLFGVFRDGSLHIKYKDRNLIAQGIVMVTCRLCGVVSRISTTNMPITLDVMTVDDMLNPGKYDNNDPVECALPEPKEPISKLETTALPEPAPNVVEEPVGDEPGATISKEETVAPPEPEPVLVEKKAKPRGRPPTKNKT